MAVAESTRSVPEYEPISLTIRPLGALLAALVSPLRALLVDGYSPQLALDDRAVDPLDALPEYALWISTTFGRPNQVGSISSRNSW